MSARVVVRDLRKSYEGVEALRGVSFTIEPGEIFGLLGPNGAGKTTAIECLIGLREPDGGELEVCGLDARRNPREVKQAIGVALQTTSLQDKITPREALRLFGAFYRERAAPEELLARFALEEKADARFETLSGGQRQRLALALAFVNRPQLVFLDEPTTGLDPQARRELHASIARMKQEGHTVLLTTHNLDEAEALCDRVAIVDRGRIVASGAPRELIAGVQGMQSVTLTTSRPLERSRLVALPGISELTLFPKFHDPREDEPGASAAGLPLAGRPSQPSRATRDGSATSAGPTGEVSGLEPGVSLGGDARAAGAGHETTVRFQTSNATATLAPLLRLLEESRIDVLDLQVRKGSLEDVFLGLTRGAETKANAKDI